MDQVSSDAWFILRKAGRLVMSRNSVEMLNGSTKQHMRRKFRGPMKTSTKHWPTGLLSLMSVMIFLLSTQAAFAKYAALVMDAATGRVLHEENADDLNYPASLTKMMTLYLVFDALESGRLRLQQKLMVSPHAAKQPPSNLGLRPGEAITVRDAILALVTKSANDVAAVVAENLAGSEPEFAELMTEKARKLGMSRTTFRNASGLPNDAQVSTARDMATLAMALLRNHPDQYAYFSTNTFEFQGTQHRNHNKLLGAYEGTDGIKTGYIHASGFNLVASVNRNNQRLIGVVFGGQTGQARDKQMMALLNQAFQRTGNQAVASVSPKQSGRRPTPVIAPPAAAPTDVRHQGLASVPTKASTSASPKGAKKASKPVDEANLASKAQATSGVVDLWGIQVGAYAKPDPAREMAERAIVQAHVLLEDGIVKVVPLLRENGRHLYRARVIGISKDQAFQACHVLERKKINCIEVHVTDPQQLASAEH